MSPSNQGLCSDGRGGLALTRKFCFVALYLEILMKKKKKGNNLRSPRSCSDSSSPCGLIPSASSDGDVLGDK